MARPRANVLFAFLLTLTIGCRHDVTTSHAPPPTLAQLALSEISLSFTTGVGQTSRPQTVTLTNTGTAALALSSITLSKTGDYAMTSTCTSTLAASASCTLTITFKPQSAADLPSTIIITDNDPQTPHIINLHGTGIAATSAAAPAAPSPSVTYTLYTFPQPDKSATPLYALVNGAQKSVDMTMYALEDPTFTTDLLAACKRGVTVRVILDQNNEKSGNTSAFTQLNGQSNCSAVWANKAFLATHEKSFVVDGTQAAIMSLNLQPQYYSTTRDFAIVENDPPDVAAIEATFNADFDAGTTASGTSGASDFTYTPGLGDHLIWSPTTAQTAMVNIITNAKKSLLIENEELASSATAILSALETACKNGVQVQLAMVNNTSYASSFAGITSAGCNLHTYPNTTAGFYIHAKAVVADYGLPTQNVYMGSINYSNASMKSNRELGMYVTDQTAITSIHDTMLADYNGGTPYAAK
jgi:phosphatidylserine/phosphatidylglycerophosphate/cardiolipin synthase-like enzyme